MKYLSFLLLLACGCKTAPTQKVVFDKSIVSNKMVSATKIDTVWVKSPLEVSYSPITDTIKLIPGYGTKGYIYKVAIVNDTLRIVDSIKNTNHRQTRGAEGGGKEDDI